MAETSERGFRGACHLVARHCGGAVVDVSHSRKRAACSYLAVTVGLAGGRVSVLANRWHPLVAFVAEGSSNRPDPEFIERPVLADAFERLSGFQPLELGLLERPLDAGMVVELGPGELRQLGHWERVYHGLLAGQVIFNTWD